MTQLGFGFTFTDLYNKSSLQNLDEEFLKFLQLRDEKLKLELDLARKYYLDPQASNLATESELIIKLAHHLEAFLNKLFLLEAKIDFAKQVKLLENLYKCKRNFVQRKALRKYKNIALAELNITNITQNIIAKIKEFSELNFANYVMENLTDDLDDFMQYAAWAIFSKEGKEKHKNTILFNIPEKHIFDNLITSDSNIAERYFLEDKNVIYRKGFSLTDKGTDLAHAIDEANYCIFCHERNKDSCAKGLKDKDGNYKKSAADIPLRGCPLEEKISEMNFLAKEGLLIGSLATAMIDNPLLAATGHRVCNDCMKSCIYQAQTPVDIPQIESHILKEIIKLPYGFELYNLLTKWNPLNLRRFLPRASTNYKILIVGSGPAGFNLAYHLLQEGHMVTMIEGLKIEPLDAKISGIDELGVRKKFTPIKNVEQELFANLAYRNAGGFGGASEYGITVRWNKNYLQLIRVILERDKNFRLYGGIRFGSQIDKKIAFDELGFDHIALCMGAGSPTIIPLKNNLSKGVKKASDFLMNLHSGNAFQENNITNLQIRLPALVIGGGLTAIDAATEILAYYPVQIRKFAQRYKFLIDKYGVDIVTEYFDDEDKEICTELLTHAKELEVAENLATKNGRKPDLIKLLRKWGGVKVLYRKSLQDSPAYKLNHEEIKHALQEGIEIITNIVPSEVVLDKYETATALKALHAKTKEKLLFPAKAILIAAGTKPNTIIAKEDSDFKLDQLYFQTLDIEGTKYIAEYNPKANNINIITYIAQNKKALSFFGDMHPDFSGNVVKAMASAKRAYPIITQILNKLPTNKLTPINFQNKLDQLLLAQIVMVKELAPKIIEVIIQAPLAARNFKPGQFYRLQNFSKNALVKRGNLMIMEGLALTGAGVLDDKISLIILEMGGSSDLCRYLKPKEPVVLMGPTGAPTKIFKNKTILLAGGGLGNAVLFSIGKALKDAGCKVLYFAAYKKVTDRYKMEQIRVAANTVIWSFDKLDKQHLEAEDKFVFEGNIVQAMQYYAQNKFIETPIKLSDVDHIIAIGSDVMMEAVKFAKEQQLKKYFNKLSSSIASVNSPMQCMMKEICAQCLQKHYDPVTKKEYFVYSCFNQDQNMDTVSFPHLKNRLKKNSASEKLTKLWIKDLL
jgi:NADPH-dependent glutamate synthase beta subunit-like oxidoreductase/NAD(P)H-flavin reductase